VKMTREAERGLSTVTELHEDHAVLDGNHPMAGMRLIFEGTVQDVQEISEEAVRGILEHHHDH
jgi:FKBP-type peptidyl-prolyl cis-trans isomerase SlyD